MLGDFDGFHKKITDGLNHILADTLAGPNATPPAGAADDESPTAVLTGLALRIAIPLAVLGGLYLYLLRRPAKASIIPKRLP